MKYCCTTHRISTVLLLVISLVIAGCGQKGPLEYTAAQQERIDIRDRERRAKQQAKERDSANEEADESQESSDPAAPEISQDLDEDPEQQR